VKFEWLLRAAESTMTETFRRRAEVSVIIILRHFELLESDFFRNSNERKVVVGRSTPLERIER
jgi:hypothetical protein